MFEPRAHDLSIVVPTRGRWPMLAECLAALQRQTVGGFEVVVSVDGEDDPPPLIPHARLVSGPRGGAGAARNRGVAATQRPLILFLDDDMIAAPQMVAAHLEAHARHPQPTTAVLGKVELHPRVARDPVNRWLERCQLQFEHARLRPGADVGFGRFYSCNVSLHRELLLDAGGFDERFLVYYEDTDLGWRLAQRGMRLRFFPQAKSYHLQRLSWADAVRRFQRVAVGERLMAACHEWFEPHYLLRLRALAASAPWWARTRSLADLTPAIVKLRSHADTVRLMALCRAYEVAFEAAGELVDLAQYLGDHFDPVRACLGPGDARRPVSEAAAALHEGVRWAMGEEMSAALDAVCRVAEVGQTVVDVGGLSGLRLVERGRRVVYADVDDHTSRFLAWRHARRGAPPPPGEEAVAPRDVAAVLVTRQNPSAPSPALADLVAAAPVVEVARTRRRRPRVSGAGLGGAVTRWLGANA